MQQPWKQHAYTVAQVIINICKILIIIIFGTIAIGSICPLFGIESFLSVNSVAGAMFGVAFLAGTYVAIDDYTNSW